MKRALLLVTVACGSDPELASWPEPYQAFVESVGGSRFVSVDGVSAHYLDTGPRNDGEPIMLLHGIPTHTYLWREVIPDLGPRRVIALDFVGFGRSDRPADFDYRPQGQLPIIDALVDELQLDRVHLVVHDLGGVAGLGWAAARPEAVASITMFETLWSTVPDGVDAIAPPFGGAGGILDQMRDPETGPVVVGDQNIFLEAYADFTVTGVSESDLAVFRHPWPNAQERGDIFLASGPLAFPLPENAEGTAYVASYQRFLEESELPKLVIDVTPGALSSILVPEDGQDGPRVSLPDYAGSRFPNVTSRTLEGAGHFVQEDVPQPLANTITEFLDNL